MSDEPQRVAERTTGHSAIYLALLHLAAVGGAAHFL